MEPQASQPVDASGGPLQLPTFGRVMAFLPGFTLRALLPAIVIIVAFALNPIPTIDNRTLLWLYEIAFAAFWLFLAFPLYLQRQLRHITQADSPETRWLEALIVLGALFLGIFAHLYRSLDDAHAGSFTQSMDPLNAYYYSVTVLSTVGFGGISPVTAAAKVFTMVQMVADIALIGLVVRVLASAARGARSSRTAKAAEDSP